MITAVAAALPDVVARAEPQAVTVTPRLFDQISTGVAYITTYGCGGRRVGQGSGFLIGTSVVMTARHVLEGACIIRVRVAGRTFRGTAWTYWRGSEKSNGRAEDLATVKLAGSSTGHVFRLREGSPPAGANLAMIGHPLGNRVSLNQGKIIAKFRYKGVPLIGVRMLGAEGASGSAFVDDSGRVVGVLQVGLGAQDVLGQHTAGVLVGIDLSRIKTRLGRALCRAYPRGGIWGCGSPSAPVSPAPRPPSPPARPMPLAVSDCWVTTTDSWEPAAKIFSLAPVSTKIFLVMELNRTAGASQQVNVTVRLDRPDGFSYFDETFSESGTAFELWRVPVNLAGRNGVAPMAGDWTLTMGVGTTPACTFGVRVEQGTRVSLTPSRTSFDPNYTYSLSGNWALLQDVPGTESLVARLISPIGATVSTDDLYLSDYTTSGTFYLTTPICTRSVFSDSDTCVYGMYRIEITRGSTVLASAQVEAYRP